jgi:type IV pilus assembly protein PilV
MRQARMKRQAGFTLIEVLVALVVMAVGMLGIAGLYIESLRTGQMSVSYTNAVTLASSMADRIRANQTGIGGYAGAAAGNAMAGTSANNCVNGIADCSSAQMAVDDWFWWYEDVKAQMPEGRQASIQVVNAAPVNVYTILLQWPERGLAAPVSYTLTFSL